MASEECSNFRTGDECESTFADEVGVGYDVFQAFYAAAVAALLYVVSVQMYRVSLDDGFVYTAVRSWYRRVFSAVIHSSYSRPSRMRTQEVLSWCCTGSVLLFIVRVIDPFGWRGIVGIDVVIFTSDITTALLMVIAITVVHSWVRAVSPELLDEPMWKHTYPVAVALTLVQFITFSALELSVGPFYLFLSIKLFISAVELLFTAAIGFYFGREIYKVLTDVQLLQMQRALKRKLSRRALDSTPFGPAMAPTAAAVPVRPPQQVAQAAIMPPVIEEEHDSASSRHSDRDASDADTPSRGPRKLSQVSTRGSQWSALTGSRKASLSMPRKSLVSDYSDPVSLASQAEAEEEEEEEMDRQLLDSFARGDLAEAMNRLHEYQSLRSVVSKRRRRRSHSLRAERDRLVQEIAAQEARLLRGSVSSDIEVGQDLASNSNLERLRAQLNALVDRIRSEDGSSDFSISSLRGRQSPVSEASDSSPTNSPSQLAGKLTGKQVLAMPASSSRASVESRVSAPGRAAAPPGRSMVSDVLRASVSQPARRGSRPISSASASALPGVPQAGRPDSVDEEDKKHDEHSVSSLACVESQSSDPPASPTNAPMLRRGSSGVEGSSEGEATQRAHRASTMWMRSSMNSMGRASMSFNTRISKSAEQRLRAIRRLTTLLVLLVASCIVGAVAMTAGGALAISERTDEDDPAQTTPDSQEFVFHISGVLLQMATCVVTLYFFHKKPAERHKPDAAPAKRQWAARNTRRTGRTISRFRSAPAARASSPVHPQLAAPALSSPDHEQQQGATVSTNSSAPPEQRTTASDQVDGEPLSPDVQAPRPPPSKFAKPTPPPGPKHELATRRNPRPVPKLPPLKLPPLPPLSGPT